jgi:hypothetical protein
VVRMAPVLRKVRRVTGDAGTEDGFVFMGMEE